MKRKREEFSVVLMDGGIRIRPGSWVHFNDDTPIQPSLEDLQNWIAYLRGKFLSETFELENDIVWLMLAAEFGTVDNAKAPPEYFLREQELRGDHSLERKIECVKVIVRRNFCEVIANRLIQGLAECRIIRNLLAHYPCWIEPQNNLELQRTVALKLYIADRHHIWQLEQEDIVKWSGIFLDVRRNLIRARHQETGAKPPEFVDGLTWLVRPN